MTQKTTPGVIPPKSPFIAKYAKGIIAVSTTVLATLGQFYGHDQWYAVAVAVAGAVAVVMVPNSK